VTVGRLVRDRQRITGLPPIARPDARVLILGSMPGSTSLAARRYYVGPGNRFWEVMASLFAIDPALRYDERVTLLQEAGVALWDVIASCERVGSLDSRIAKGSEVANDFHAFLAEHPSVRAVALNGRKAHDLFRTGVAARVLADHSVELIALPSSSGANTRFTSDALTVRWREIVAYV
jgi:hypoxanthine-DNA glycosylase